MELSINVEQEEDTMADTEELILAQVVADLEDRLSGPAKERFMQLPPSHKKEWARYISDAKKDETKLRRLEKMKKDLLG